MSSPNSAAAVSLGHDSRVDGRLVPSKKVLKYLFVFVLGVSYVIEIKIVGTLTVAEILLLGLLPYLLLWHGKRLAFPLPATILALGMIWGASQMVTDVLRDTPFIDYARGWARVVFLLANFASLYLIINDSGRRLVAFCLGWCVGGILRYLVGIGDFGGEPWKFGVGLPVSLLLTMTAMIPAVRSMRLAPQVILLAVVALNLLFNARSIAAIFFLTFVVVSLQRRLGRSSPGGGASAFSFSRLLLLGVMLLAAAQGLTAIYSRAAGQGLLGEEAQEKFEKQSGTEYPLLLAGRSEILISSQAILESPVVGHGSWAKDAKYRRMFARLKERLSGTPNNPDYLPNDEIPTHSHLFGAWVEAGDIWRRVLVLRTWSRPLRTRCTSLE
jgi:hypothetical protein